MKSALAYVVLVFGIVGFTAHVVQSAEPASAEGHYYHYFKERRALVLDAGRVAVQIGSTVAQPIEPPTLRGEEFFQQPSTPLAIKGWYFAALKPEKASSTGVQSAVSRVVDQGMAAFSSPVFVGREGGPVVITSKLLVGFRPTVPGAAAEAILAEAGAGTIQDRNWANMLGAYRIKSAARDGFAVLAIANALAQKPEILYAEPDMIFTGRGSLIPNDPFFVDAWGIHNTGQAGGTPDADMDGPEAWDITLGDPSIKVLIMDTGVQQNHPDINQLPGADVTSDGPGGGGNPINVCDNHGTAVAGCVSATINNALGTLGIAPACKSISVRFAISTLDCSGSWNGQSSWTVDALAFGESMGVRVTNNSNGYAALASAAIETKYEQTRNDGMVHFASAMNNGQPVSGYPASLPTVNSIAALERHGNRASFSNYGPDIFVSAPGESIISTDRTGGAGYVGGDYVFVQGTSFASPYTAGVAALVLTINPVLPASSVESILASSAVDLGVAGWDTDFGWGFVNAHRAIVTAQGGCNDPGPPDCNNNNISDECDLFDGTSQDCNFNATPDECESAADCQPNGNADICDIGSGLSFDCNGNSTPDECDVVSASDDCNSNLIPDECDSLAVASLTNSRPAILGFVDISTTGTPLNLTDDSSATVTIPFAPPSFPSAQARISNNGVMGFGNTGDVFNPNEPLPSSLLFDFGTALLAYWDDFDDSTGNVYHQTVGTSPNRTFIAQWHNRPRFPGDAVLDGDEGTFQIQVFETPVTGAVAQYVYADTTFVGPTVNNGRSATTGYQRNSQAAIQYSHNLTDSITPSVVLTLIEADCQGNGAIDSCELAGGAPDCNTNGIIDQCDIAREQDPDCNDTNVPDSCDISEGTSQDVNGNLVPDECDLPPDLLAEPDGLDRTRFISFTVPASQTAGPSSTTALRVRLVSLHHVVPPYSGAPSVPFTSFEGQVRWVGPPAQYVESTASAIPFHAASLQCSPHYQDWTTISLLHVTGSAITPSSQYDVENVADGCAGSEAGCTMVSAALSLATTRWGDVKDPYNPPDPSIQPDISDVSALVDKFRSAPGAPPKVRGLLAGEPGNPFGEITPAVIGVDYGFSHISACVDAFRGAAYPYTIQACP